MIDREWYQARIRWAEMVEGRGIRSWEEAVYLFRSEDYDSALERALAIGEGCQSGGEEGTRHPRWVETRLRKVTVVATLAKPPAKFTRGLSISPDGRYALYCQDDVDRYEIRVVENFR